MKTHTQTKFTITALLLTALTAASVNAAVMNYVITGYDTNSGVFGGGTDGTDTDVSSSGSSSQTETAPAGTFVDFTIGDADTITGDKFADANINALPTVATLRVTVAAISGDVMITRTSNSQGLEDIGTMSVLLTGSGALSATFDFQWRNAANDAVLTGSDQMVFTSYDIDFTQRNSITVGDYSSIGTSTNPDPTNLTISTSSGTTSISDMGDTDSNFGDPENAYAFLTTAGDYEQSISVDKIDNAGGNQLYMFSFRSPSPLITTIPEPSVALLGGLGLLAFLRRRR